MRVILALTLGLAALVPVFWPAPSSAFVCKHSNRYEYVSLHWETRTIPYGIRQGTPVDEGDVAGCFSEWSGQPCTDIQFKYLGNNLTESQKNVSQIIFVPDGWTERLNSDQTPRDPSIVALTITSYTVDTGAIRVANIEFNTDHFELGDVTEDRSCDDDRKMDLIAVLTHEIGHLLGLDHTQPENETATMAAYVGSCEADKRSLEEDDIAGLCLLYPAGRPTGFCEDLPAQDESYITNQPLGCACRANTAPTGATSDASGVLFAALALVVVFTRRERRPRRC